MFGIDFLRQGKLSGLEFMDFVTNNFADELTAAIEPHVTINRAEETVLNGSVKEAILPVIEKYTGFKNITVEMMDFANFMVDVGYLSPGNILNIKGIEDWFDVTDSTLSQWYSKNKGKMFKGTIDYRTGKVGGAYAELPIKLYLGRPVGDIFKRSEVKKLNISVATMIAACIAHEMGHCFSACSTVDTTANDNFVIRGALATLGAANTKEKRVAVIRNAAVLLGGDINTRDNVEAMVEDEDRVNDIVIYFNALISRRNTRRALSLGVDQMSSEVLADMYAIRMGFDRGITATLKIFAAGRVGNIAQSTGVMSLLVAIAFIQFAPIAPLLYLGIIAAGFLVSFVFVYGVMSYSGDYNSPFRRFEDAVRQLIAKLKTMELTGKERLEIAERAAALLKQCEELRPIIAGTVLDRALGRLIQGSDFKYQEFEHFSQVIANNELEILNVKIANLSA